MEGALAVIVLGAVMIVAGLAPGLWSGLVAGVAEGIANFSDALRGNPAYESGISSSSTKREPLVALLGVALVLLGILSFLSA